MSEKSHVSLEQNLCIVCLDDFDTGAVLLDRRLRPILKHYTRTGWGMCPTCSKKRDEGYIALIAADPSKSKIDHRSDTLKPSGAYRTGDILHIRKQVWDKVFTVPMPENGVAFVDPDVVAMLKKAATEGETK